jgi:TRAP-type mannitol/chloroaromatic compound transport system permease small subunit
MNIFNNGIIVALCLAIIDIISMGITKQIDLGYLQKSWLPFAFILYGCQMLIFKYGLNITSMTVLNLSWNLFSNIVITLIGIYYFKENINNLETYGILFAIFALFLFGLSEFNK